VWTVDSCQSDLPTFPELGLSEVIDEQLWQNSTEQTLINFGQTSPAGSEASDTGPDLV